MNNRRKLLIALGAASLTPRMLYAQATQPILIGWLNAGSRESGAHLLTALKEGLAALEWKEGPQFRIEERWGDGQARRLPSLTQELAAQKPALIVAWGLSVTVAVAKEAPPIPIVMVSSSDPVAAGVVASLARPNGMITGVAGFGIELAGKSLELLLAAAPKIKRIGFLNYAYSATGTRAMEAARRSAIQHSVEPRFADVASPKEIEPAISGLAKDGVRALVVLPGVLLLTERRRIVGLALAQRWPVVGGQSEWPAAGALLSYGVDNMANTRRAAYYVDRILKGAKPGDISIEQPTTFELVVNLKTAKALGLTMPPEIMVRATRVIE